MRILLHLSGLALFICLYFLGKLLCGRTERGAGALVRVPVPKERARNFFLYSGRVVEGIAIVFGFLEAVALLILTSGAVIDLLLMISFA